MKKLLLKIMGIYLILNIFITYNITNEFTFCISNNNQVKFEVENKLKDLYGAKGDGKTDDTKAIQNALNNEEYIYFPKGIYIVTSHLNIYSNTTIEMHPDTVIKRNGKDKHYKVFINGTIGSNMATEYNGEGNIHFINGTIDLNSIENPLPYDKNTTVMDIGHAKDVSFTNMTFKNGQNGHYFQVSGSKNVLFYRCKFKDVQHTNTDNSNYEVIQIEPISKKGFPTFGAYDYTISKNITIEECEFTNVIRAIGTHASVLKNNEVVYCENIKIINNKFKNSIDSMISLKSYKNVEVLGNTIELSGRESISLIDVHDSIFKNNTIVGNLEKEIKQRNSSGNMLKDNYYINY